MSHLSGNLISGSVLLVVLFGLELFQSLKVFLTASFTQTDLESVYGKIRTEEPLCDILGSIMCYHLVFPEYLLPLFSINSDS